MVEIEFINSKDNPIFVQVDHWACLYKLNKGQSITFAADVTSEQMRISIDELDSNNRILTLLDCEEFYILVDGKRVHWTEYQTNLTESE